MLENLTLQTHLNNDGFFDLNDTLILIDDYNARNISNNAIDFFVENFKDTGLRKLNIYYQVKMPRKECRVRFLECSRRLARQHNISSDELIGLSCLCYKSTNEDSLSKVIDNSDTDNKNTLKQFDRFFSEMEHIDVNVTFFPYNSLNCRPPFHGRYWLTRNGKGYIVDGSLNSYSRNKIFAQLMDEENYQTVYNLFRREIEPETICGEGIDYIRYRRIVQSLGHHI